MAITNFIPQVWSARLQENLKRALVFGSLCNRNYEGDIAQWGDTVHINTLNDISIKPYNPAISIDNPEQLSGTNTTLTIDHGAYYNFYINDVDAAQARTDLMDAAMRNAAYQLAADAEQYIIDAIRLGAEAKVEFPMPTAESGGLYELLLQIKTGFDSMGVPRYERKLIIPPSLEAMLLMDNRFITGSAAASEHLTEGSIARALGFDIYVSVDLDNELIAMIPDAVTFANQITKVEAYRPEKGFSDGLKGLCLSGAKVTMPNAVIVCTMISE
nr:hypothetical protein [Clostridia bacterium]